jgi:hypothetical protein
MIQVDAYKDVRCSREDVNAKLTIGLTAAARVRQRSTGSGIQHAELAALMCVLTAQGSTSKTDFCGLLPLPNNPQATQQWQQLDRCLRCPAQHAPAAHMSGQPLAVSPTEVQSALQGTQPSNSPPHPLSQACGHPSPGQPRQPCSALLSSHLQDTEVAKGTTHVSSAFEHTIRCPSAHRHNRIMPKELSCNAASP